MKNITLPPALRSARKPMPTTAATARPYRRLTAVPNTGLIVPASAKPNTTTTAATGLRSFPPVRQMRPVLTSPTAPQKSVPGPAIPVINKKEALVFLLACPKKTKQVAAMEHIPAVMAVAETEPVAVPLR